MPKYTFTFKKDDIFAEFTTTDKDIVERQFQIWVADADDYVSNRPRRSASVLASNSVTKAETEVKEQEVKVDQKIEAEPEQIQQPEQNEQTTEQPEVFEKASSLLKTINTIQGANVEASEEAVTQEKSAETVNFEEVLEKTIENPTFEPDKIQDQVFLNLIRSKNTTDKFHYLVITAYYLSEFEKMERFSLKQINAKLMHNLSEVIDHLTLQEAINQNFIELVPDLTGISEVGEYRLTPAGEDFFANKI